MPSICLLIIQINYLKKEILMIIQKADGFWTKFRYTKIYRSFLYILRRLLYLTPDPKKEYKVKMRLGHLIYFFPTQNYLKNLLFSRQYHDLDVFLIDRVTPNDGVILDIGANIGLYSCMMAQKMAAKNITIHAIEAVQNNMNVLKKNTEVNGFKNIHLHKIALGNEPGELVFNLPDENFVGNAIGGNIAQDPNHTFKETVPLTTLDQWAKENKISRCDFMKIDIEGAELLAFQGGKEFLAKTRPIIQTEYNQGLFKNSGFHFKDLKSFFTDLNYQIFLEDGESFIHLNSDELDAYLKDLLLVPEEKLAQFGL